MTAWSDFENGDWTGRKCPACKGTGEAGPDAYCGQCGHTGDEYWLASEWQAWRDAGCPEIGVRTPVR